MTASTRSAAGRSLRSAAAIAILAASLGSNSAHITAIGQSASATATARIAGRVVDAADGRTPVRRAIVTITGDRLPAGRSAITDDDGRFSFTRVPAGTVTLSATRGGFLRAVFGAMRLGRPGTPITVRGGEDAVNLSLAMTHGSALDGVLRDIAGDPAPGMRVEAIRILHSSAGDRGESAGVSLTDDRGEFRIFDLAAGEYALVATGVIVVSGIGDIGAPSEAEVDALLASIGRRASAGSGASSPVAPPAPVALKSYAAAATFYPGVLAPGDAARIQLGANDDRDGLDFAMRLGHAASIDGVITPVRGQTVPPVLISIQGSGSELPVFGGSASGPSVSVRAADHTFHISNVLPGHYKILARTAGGPSGSSGMISSGGSLPSPGAGASAQWALTEIDIGTDDIAGVTLAMQAALRLTGRVVFDAATQRPPGDAS